MQIVHAQFKLARGEPNAWCTSIGTIAELLSTPNRELLALIAREKPNSLIELAELSGRSRSTVSRTLKTLSRFGLVELKPGKHGRLIPLVHFDRARPDISVSEKKPHCGSPRPFIEHLLDMPDIGEDADFDRKLFEPPETK